jgi:hypothetical protein
MQPSTHHANQNLTKNNLTPSVPPKTGSCMKQNKLNSSDKIFYRFRTQCYDFLNYYSIQPSFYFSVDQFVKVQFPTHRWLWIDVQNNKTKH